MALWKKVIVSWLLIAATIIVARSVSSDPFRRVSLAVEIGGQRRTFIAVTPARNERYPIVLFFPPHRRVEPSTGVELRRIAEQHMAAIAVESTQLNVTSLSDIVSALLRRCKREPWADTTRVSWIGMEGTDDALLQCLRATPASQSPICLAVYTGFAPPLRISPALSSCKVLVVAPSVADANSNKAPIITTIGAVIAYTIPVNVDTYDSDRAAVFRIIIEQAAKVSDVSFSRRVVSSFSLSDYRQLLVVTLGVFVALFLARGYLHARASCKAYRNYSIIAASALASSVAAIAVSTLYKGQLRSITCTALTMPRESLRFPRTVSSLDVSNQLTSAEVRQVSVQYRLSEAECQLYVLLSRSDRVTDMDHCAMPVLWRYFYPRTRSTKDSSMIAHIVVAELRDRLSFTESAPISEGILSTWNRGTASRTQFNKVYVAALHALGVTSRLAPSGVQIKTEMGWSPAPEPLAVRD